MFDVTAALRSLVEAGGSDLHLKVGAPPLMRLEGLLRPIDPASPPLQPPDTEAAVARLLEGQSELREGFARDGEADFAFALPGLARYRVSAFRQRGSVSIVCRAIPFPIRSLA